MTLDESIQKSLSGLGELLTPPASFADEVMRRVDQLGPGVPGRTGRGMRSSIGIAACITIGVVAWLVLGTAAPQTLYAQAIKAIEEARTVHMVGRQLREAKWVKAMEAFYERGVGVAEFSYGEGHSFFRIDDGKHCWRKTGSGPLVRSKSADTLGIVKKAFRSAAKALEGQQNVTRDPKGDRAIDGVDCKQYVLVWSQGRLRTLIWVDDRDRVRRFEKQQPAGDGWETYRVIEIRYDVPIDRSRFQVKTSPAVTLIDAEKLLAERFSLEKALFKKELMGLIFAVHELQQAEDGMIFVVCSLRPSEAVIRELGPIRSATMGSKVYGEFQLDSSWKRVDGKERYYQPTTLGSLQYDGMDAKWMLLHPLGDWPEGTATCELSAYLYTRGKLKDKRTQAGLEWYRRYKPLTELALPPIKLPLKEVIRAIYADVLAVEPIGEGAHLLEASRLRPEGTWSRRYRRPSDFSLEQFAAEVQGELDHLEQLRREWRQRDKARSRPSK